MNKHAFILSIGAAVVIAVATFYSTRSDDDEMAQEQEAKTNLIKHSNTDIADLKKQPQEGLSASVQREPPKSAGQDTQRQTSTVAKGSERRIEETPTRENLNDLATIDTGYLDHSISDYEWEVGGYEPVSTPAMGPAPEADSPDIPELPPEESGFAEPGLEPEAFDTGFQGPAPEDS